MLNIYEQIDANKRKSAIILVFFIAFILVASATMAYAFVVSWGLAKILKATMGLRVSESEEVVGLDISQHGERAYGGALR